VLLVNTVNLNAAGFPTVDVQAVNGQLGNVDTNVFDTNVVVLPVSIPALGINPAAASHSYTVGVAGYYTAPGDSTALIDSIGTPLSFDALAPAYSVQSAAPRRRCTGPCRAPPWWSPATRCRCPRTPSRACWHWTCTTQTAPALRHPAPLERTARAEVLPGRVLPVWVSRPVRN
jgi:hypothetical protein